MKFQWRFLNIQPITISTFLHLNLSSWNCCPSKLGFQSITHIPYRYVNDFSFPRKFLYASFCNWLLMIKFLCADFDMSDIQQEHALAIERLTPNLAYLRLELWPGYLSNGQFWKIYFVLLHPQLSKEDALFITTPQVIILISFLSWTGHLHESKHHISQSLKYYCV